MATGSGSGQPVHFTSLLGSKDGHGLRLSEVRSGPRELMGIRVHLAVHGDASGTETRPARSGAHDTAKTMIQDILTIRAAPGVEMNEKKDQDEKNDKDDDDEDDDDDDDDVMMMMIMMMMI